MSNGDQLLLPARAATSPTVGRRFRDVTRTPGSALWLEELGLGGGHREVKQTWHRNYVLQLVVVHFLFHLHQSKAEET